MWVLKTWADLTIHSSLRAGISKRRLNRAACHFTPCLRKERPVSRSSTKHGHPSGPFRLDDRLRRTNVPGLHSGVGTGKLGHHPVYWMNRRFLTNWTGLWRVYACLPWFPPSHAVKAYLDRHQAHQLPLPPIEIYWISVRKQDTISFLHVC